jgi:pentatricopeptide repeat protein
VKSKLARTLCELGELDEARTLYEQAIARCHCENRHNHPDTLNMQHQLAITIRLQNGETMA